MKKILACAVLTLSLAGLPAASAQSTSDLFQQGLRKERVEGDLKSAIAIYRRLIQEHPADRPLVARALIQLGGAYERMGNADARAAYERVVRDYPEQSTEASLARTRIAALGGNLKVSVRTETTVGRLWSGPGVDILGGPTPDGRMLTFVDWATGDLAVRDLSTGENRRLTSKGSWTTSDAFALNSVPSPDGKTVAYAWWGDDGKTVSVKLIPIGGGVARTVYSGEAIDYVQPWEWTPDGRELLATVKLKAGKTQIVLLSVADSSVRTLKTLGRVRPSKVSLSRDARFVAYDYPAADGVQQHDIFILRIADGAQSTLVRDPNQDLLIGWTPDGGGVLFASDRIGNMSVWMQGVSNGVAVGDASLLRRDAEITMSPMTVTKDGTFFYGSIASPTDVYVADVTPNANLTNPKRLVERYVGENRNADWSPDGSSIVYLSQRQPGPAPTSRILVVRSLIDGGERIVPIKVALQGGSAPHFWPDGKSISVMGTDETGRNGYFLVDPAGGGATFLFGTNPGQFAGIADGGKSIIVIERDFAKGEAKLVRHNIIDSTQADIYGFTGKKGYNIAWPSISPDGTSVAFVYYEPSPYASAVRVVSLAGGEPRDIVRATRGFEFRNVAWSADGKMLYFSQNRVIDDGHGGLTSDDDHEPIMRVPAGGGTPVETGIVADNIRAIRVSSDGKRISYTAGRNASEVWAMENFLPKPPRRTAARRK